MSGILQSVIGNTYKLAPPTAIGQSYAGGYYAGKMSLTSDGVATHYLVVSPRSLGETVMYFGTYDIVSYTTSDNDGYLNTQNLAADRATNIAPIWCKNLTIGGYTDWYLPSINESGIIYYYLKPSTDNNDQSFGSNPIAVTPQPRNTLYTPTLPPQTTISNFILGGSEAFVNNNYYWTSSFYNPGNRPKIIAFSTGAHRDGLMALQTCNLRAIRRVPV